MLTRFLCGVAFAALSASTASADDLSMDAAYISAVAALAGSTIGALASFATTWVMHYSQARATLRGDLDIAYGPGSDERLDWFHTDAANAPVLSFIHAGAWRNVVAQHVADDPA